MITRRQGMQLHKSVSSLLTAAMDYADKGTQPPSEHGELFRKLNRANREFNKLVQKLQEPDDAVKKTTK